MYILRVVISLFFIPYITSVLGDARYGVWVIIFQTINYFVLLDFGLEKALVRFVSRHLSERNFAAINRVLNTAFGLYIGLGLAIMGGVWLTATFLFGFIRVEDAGLIAEGAAALKIIGLYLGLRFFMMPFAGSLGGFQRFDISNTLQMIEDVIRTGIMVGLLYSGYGLVALAWSIVIMSVLRQAIAWVWLAELHPEVRLSVRNFSRDQARELFQYSKIALGITLAWLVIFNTDTILLGLLASSSMAGVYGPGATVMLYARLFVNSAAAPLTAAVSHLEATGDRDRIRELYVRGIRYASYFSFFVAASVALYARPFVDLWLAPEFAEASEVMRILAVGSAFYIPQIIGNAVLFGIDRHAVLLRVLLIEAALKLTLALILIEPYGVRGMAAAAVAPQVLLYVSLYPALIGRTIGLPVAGIMLTSLRSGMVAMFATVPPAVMLRMAIVPDSWGSIAVNVITVVVIAGGASWFVLTSGDRDRLRGLLRSR